MPAVLLQVSSRCLSLLLLLLATVVTRVSDATALAVSGCGHRRHRSSAVEFSDGVWCLGIAFMVAVVLATTPKHLQRPRPGPIMKPKPCMYSLPSSWLG